MTEKPETGGSAGPVLTAHHNLDERQVQLSFMAYQPMDNYVGEYLVTALAETMQVSVPVIASLGGDNLPGFIRGLTEDFKGWQGVQSWRSLEDQLRIDAEWRSGGHVVLGFHLTPSVYDKWKLSVDITLEAGEEMTNLSRDLEAFFAR